jgi:hypothetical protein
MSHSIRWDGFGLFMTACEARHLFSARCIACNTYRVKWTAQRLVSANLVGLVTNHADVDAGTRHAVANTMPSNACTALSQAKMTKAIS